MAARDINPSGQPSTPGQRILALNLGSATLKAALFVVREVEARDGGTCEEIARVELPHDQDVARQLPELMRALPGESASPTVVVHRIVHGGDLVEGAEVDDALFATLESLAAWAPLHQPPALALVRAACARWPQARHGVAFDTSFHATLAPWSRRLPIPEEWNAAGVRRYGFHGLAFASALRQIGHASPSAHDGRVVLVHLGGGCSVCAVRRGRSIDTTMGLTPLGGIPSPTRSGDLDPGVLLHLLHQGIDAAGLQERLSHEAGLLGMGGSADIRELLHAWQPTSAVALEHFTHRIAQAIAAMATAVGGIDHLVFSGGIGHHSPALRSGIAAHLQWLGVWLDDDRNARGEFRISGDTGPLVWNVAVDEERELALSTRHWLGLGAAAPDT